MVKSAERAISARPTFYKGTKMRSRLEASFAAWLDNRDVSWVYEPLCFANEQGQYLPDFAHVLVERDGRPIRLEYVEVKPLMSAVPPAMIRMEIIHSTDPTAILSVYLPSGSGFCCVAARVNASNHWYMRPPGSPLWTRLGEAQPRWTTDDVFEGWE